jgi:hypothetical protein
MNQIYFCHVAWNSFKKGFYFWVIRGFHEAQQAGPLPFYNDCLKALHVTIPDPIPDSGALAANGCKKYLL